MFDTLEEFMTAKHSHRKITPAIQAAWDKRGETGVNEFLHENPLEGTRKIGVDMATAPDQSHVTVSSTDNQITLTPTASTGNPSPDTLACQRFDEFKSRYEGKMVRLSTSGPTRYKRPAHLVEIIGDYQHFLMTFQVPNIVVGAKTPELVNLAAGAQDLVAVRSPGDAVLDRPGLSLYDDDEIRSIRAAAFGQRYGTPGPAGVRALQSFQESFQAWKHQFHGDSKGFPERD